MIRRTNGQRLRYLRFVEADPDPIQRGRVNGRRNANDRAMQVDQEPAVLSVNEAHQINPILLLYVAETLTSSRASVKDPKYADSCHHRRSLA